MTATYLPHACGAMSLFVKDERVPVVYGPRFREYSLALVESDSHQLIRFCPWCGTELPGSLRDRFFDEMDQMGIDYIPGVNFPDEAWLSRYNSDAWWREDGSLPAPDGS